MAKDLDVIKKYTLKLSYICPVTGKEVILTNTPGNEEFELEGNESMARGYYDVSISLRSCISCGRPHDTFKVN